MLNLNRTPIILVGQIYLHEALNEYMIVTKNNRGQIYYEGSGFKGSCEDVDFIEKFPAVNPEDVDEVEIEFLLGFCPSGTEALIGYVGE